MKTESFPLRLDKLMKIRLKKARAKLKLSMSEIIRRAVDKFLKEIGV